MNARQRVSKWRDLPVWLQVLAVIAFVNFTIFWIVAVDSGGDAWNGYQRDGKYFLASHGKYTQVSHRFWMYSYYHVIATWVTHSAVLIGAAVYYCSRRAAQTI
jgi:hypothetical protein